MFFVTKVLGELRFCQGLPSLLQAKHRPARGLRLGRELTRNVVIQNQNRKSPLWDNDKMELLEITLLCQKEPCAIPRKCKRGLIRRTDLFLNRLHKFSLLKTIKCLSFNMKGKFLKIHFHYSQQLIQTWALPTLQLSCFKIPKFSPSYW
jgi:hypothetical protein